MKKLIEYADMGFNQHPHTNIEKDEFTMAITKMAKLDATLTSIDTDKFEECLTNMSVLTIGHGENEHYIELDGYFKDEFSYLEDVCEILKGVKNGR